jgi:hypothetical protein
VTTGSLEKLSHPFEFIYIGETTITEENVFGLRSLAQMYDYPDLLKQTNVFFQEKITEQNCLSMICSAQQWAAEGRPSTTPIPPLLALAYCL